jgi:hypothetical protein
VSTFTSAGGQQSVTLTGATTPTVANVAMTTAGTEYSYSLPSGTKKFLIKLRGGSEFKVAYSATTSGTIYISVAKYNWYGESDMDLSGLTIYFQSPTASETAEIISWV